MKHWIAMAGMRGCMPHYCEAHRTKADAVEDLLVIHDDAEVGRPRVKSQLTRKGDTWACIDLHKWGNEILEVVCCDCDEPWVHSDSGEKQDWMTDED